MQARRRLVPLVVLLALAAVTPTASAHDGLRSADPAPGSELASAPRFLRLRLVTPPRRDPRTFVSVVGPGGADLARGDPTVSGLGLEQPLDRATASGRYTVSYTVVAADGHLAQGRFTFVLRVAARPAASADGGDGSALALAGALTLVVVGVVVARLRARPSTASERPPPERP